MEELVDVLDAVTGKKTGEIVSKNYAHLHGIWHGSVHLIIIDKSKKNVLLQKRCSKKALFPNMWDIIVGGHISSLEDCNIAIKRELKEELGLDIFNYKFKKIDRIKEEFFDNVLVSKEYVDVFLVVDDVNIDDIVLQEDEVSEVRWFNKDEFNKLIEDNVIVKHSKEFAFINSILVN